MAGETPGRESRRRRPAPADTTAPPQRLFVGEAELRAILDAIPARVALYDRARRHVYANREYARLVGRTPEEVVGLTLEEVMGRETYARVEPFYLQLRPHSRRALEGEVSRWDGWLPFSADGEPRFVQRLYVPHRDGPGGEVDGYFVFSRDLTDLKRSEALNGAITAAALDCILVADEQGHLVEFNPAAERTFGLTRAQALGRPSRSLISAPGHLWRALMRGEEPGAAPAPAAPDGAAPLGRRIEAEGIRADGTRFPVELAVSEVRLADRRLFAAWLRDLTGARAAAAEIERQREALAQGEKLAALGSLLAGVSHELNNPLAILLAGTLMLQEDLEAAALPELAARAERIRAAAERCARIVRSFLAIARRQEAKRQPVAVAAVVEGVLELLAYGLRSDGIEVRRSLPEALPPVLADADRLHQVLANLVANAHQALQGRPGPRLVRIEAGFEDGAVTIAVADNGPGVPPEIRGRIFDPFFTTKPVGAGTGIGLSVSRSIAEAHGGTLELADPPAEFGGDGTCFVLRLPRAPPERRARARSRPREAAGAAARPGNGATTPAGDRRALVVDDEPELRDVIVTILEGLGLGCDQAGNGREARRMLARRDYAVVLCDLRMPDMGGPALFEWMEAERPALCGRVAFMTGDVLGESAAGFLRRAGRPLIEKPFAPEEIRRVVRGLLDPR